jgi:hemoglobin/transferrin/lactoferrin receptor protein
VLYGSDAIGGVVQVFTHDIPFSDTTFLVQGNIVGKWISHSMEKTSRAMLTLSDKNVAFSGGLTYSDFGDIVAGSGIGKESPTGYRSYATDAKLKLRLQNNHTLTFAIQYYRQNDVPRYDRILAGYQRYHFNPQIRLLGYTRLNSEFKGKYLQNLTFTVFFGQSHEKRNLQRTGQVLIVNELDIVNSYGVIAEFRSNPSLNWNITSGIEYYHDKIKSNKTEIRGTQMINKRGYYPDGATSSNFAMFTSHSVSISRFCFTVSGRYNMLSIQAVDPDFENIQLNPDAFVAKTSVVFNFHPNHRIIASAYSAFRSPNINDLSSFGIFAFGIEVPNPSLVPEKSFTTEMGIKSRKHNLSGSVFLFNNRLTNLIERIPASWNGQDSINGEKVFKKTNFARANIKGVEAELAYALNKTLSFNFNLTYTYGHNITRNEPMTRIPPLFGRIGAYYTNPKGFWSKFEWLSAGLQDRLSSSDISDTRIPEDGTPGWNILNYRIGYTWKWISINTGIDNIFNVAYRTHGSGVHGYGRHIRMSVSLSIP